MGWDAKGLYGLRRIEGPERAIIDRKLAESLEDFVREKYERRMETLEEVKKEINRKIVSYSDSKKKVDRYWLMGFCRKAIVKIRDIQKQKLCKMGGRLKLIKKIKNSLKREARKERRMVLSIVL